MAGTFEEIGWTGFATLRLLRRWRPFVVEFAVLYVATSTAYRVLMTATYARTESLLLAVHIHASYTGW